MSHLKQLGIHTSAMLLSYGVEGPSEKRISKGAFAYQWEELGDELRVSLYDNSHILVMDFDPDNFENNRGGTFNLLTGIVQLVETIDDRESMAEYMMLLIT